MNKITEFDEMRLRAILGDKQGIAKQWIEEYVEELNSHWTVEDTADYGDQTLSFNELVEAAKDNILSNSSWPEYICKGPLLEGESVSPEFWNNLEDYLGITIPAEKRQDFFTCAC